MYGKSACPVLRGTGEQPKVWLRYCGTAGKLGGNRENKHQPVAMGGPGLLDYLNFLILSFNPSIPKFFNSSIYRL